MDELKILAPLDNESPNAYQAFTDYVAMGYSRSIDKLVVRYQNATVQIPTQRIGTLKTWSKKFEWQRRINEYQQQIAVAGQMNRVEAFNQHMVDAIPTAGLLLTKMQQMLDDFQRLRTTRRVMIDDPRDAALPAPERRQIESIQTKVNVSDLQKLVSTFGSLNKDFRTALGLPNAVEVKGVESTVIKTYIGVSPDDWATGNLPAEIPASIDEDIEDPTEDFNE